MNIFAQVAAAHGEHADGALYWKAYAEDKLGQYRAAQDSCAELRKGYPKSGWAEDCSALEVEIRGKTGLPVEIEPGESDEVKLLALNAIMRQDEPRALKEIQTILNGDSSERLKKEAQFILGQHYSNATYAQIVRVSYVEGDVRVQRGVANEKASGGSWEQAVANLPVETGFSLVTGAGRAEIEFEERLDDLPGRELGSDVQRSAHDIRHPLHGTGTAFRHRVFVLPSLRSRRAICSADADGRRGLEVSGQNLREDRELHGCHGDHAAGGWVAASAGGGSRID